MTVRPDTSLTWKESLKEWKREERVAVVGVRVGLSGLVCVSAQAVASVGWISLASYWICWSCGTDLRWGMGIEPGRCRRKWRRAEGRGSKVLLDCAVTFLSAVSVLIEWSIWFIVADHRRLLSDRSLLYEPDFPFRIPITWGESRIGLNRIAHFFFCLPRRSVKRGIGLLSTQHVLHS